jgi:hypothetical protein
MQKIAKVHIVNFAWSNTFNTNSLDNFNIKSLSFIIISMPFPSLKAQNVMKSYLGQSFYFIIKP